MFKDALSLQAAPALAIFISTPTELSTPKYTFLTWRKTFFYIVMWISE